MTPKDHHFIPRLHLQYFEGNDPPGQVWTYDKETRLWRSAIARETAVQKHFYTFNDADDNKDASIEHYLALCESNAAAPYRAMLDGVVPAGEDRMHFAQFAALMYVRTPAMRRSVATMLGQFTQLHRYAYGAHDGAFRILMRDVERETGPLPEQEREELRQSLLDPSEHVFRYEQNPFFVPIELCDTLRPLFHKMNWTLVTPDHGFFVSSDNPLVRWSDPKTHHPMMGDGGFSNRTLEVSLPLSSKVMLLMSRRDDAVSHARTERAAPFNALRAAHADRYLYAHVKDKRLERLANSYGPGGGVQASLKGGFGPQRFGKVEVTRLRPRPVKGRGE